MKILSKYAHQSARYRLAKCEREPRATLCTTFMPIVPFRIPTESGIQEVGSLSAFSGSLWAAISLVGITLSSVMVMDHIMRDAATQISKWPTITALLSRLIKRSIETTLLFTGFGIKLNRRRFGPLRVSLFLGRFLGDPSRGY